ncbi:Pullulanase precursor [compost metagenome]
MMVLYDKYGQPAPRAKIIEIHYDRPDGDYRGWNLWVWGTGIQDGQCDFRHIDEDGHAVARVEVIPGTASVGYILRLNDWEEKDGSGDRFIDCSGNDELVKVLVRDREQENGGNVDDPLQLTS